MGGWVRYWLRGERLGHWLGEKLSEWLNECLSERIGMS